MDTARMQGEEGGDWSACRLSWVRRVLFLGDVEARDLEGLHREGVEVCVAPADPAVDKDTFGEGSFDAIFVGSPERPVATADDVVSSARVWLSRYGTFMLCLSCNRDTMEMTLGGAGLKLYAFWWVRTGGVVVSGAPGTPPDYAAAQLIMAVRSDYDPVAHARALFSSGHIVWSLEVLSNVPEGFLSTAEAKAALAVETQRCILAWDRAAGPEGRLARFSRALRQFYIATTLMPLLREAYVIQAAFWHVLGEEGMAGRLLRSVDYAMGKSVEVVARRRVRAPEEAPAWSGLWRPRVLLICHRESDYGLDTLYDGLRRVLGAERVIEFPWKPTLHGQAPERTYGYPCLFDHPGESVDVFALCESLRAGLFDVVLVADTLKTLEHTLLEPLMDAVGDTPLFIVDTWDEAGDYQEDILLHLGRERAAACFKREMLECGSYGENTYPLPFAYPDGLIAEETDWARREGVFWAGKRQCGLRCLYLGDLAGRLGLHFDQLYDPQQYVEALRKTQIGLSFFGLGFDTVRYWELPAHGCLLLAERPPIRIPHDFRDGETAVFFDDLPELETKLRYYLAHPGESRAIAEAGHAHVLEYHTGSARARQLLGRIERILG
ncbi:MAG TPA: glycosyltransferase family 1 protein [Candidatus Hydrogenedentes bacterium]|nr:glycosyltransferase family 1 protein [Candidatus Hydrogenedentota bacterium]